MNQELEQVAADIRSGIETNPVEGSTSLVLFANAYALDARLRHSALILRLNYGKARDNGQRWRLRSEMLTLIDDIVEDCKVGAREGRAKPFDQMVERAQTCYQDVKPPRDLVFRCQDLGKTYRKSGFRLQGVDLQLRLGEILGVVGENGNGKTTLFRLIAGDLCHDQGNMAFPSVDQNSSRSKRIDWVKVKQDVGYVPQELPKLYGSMEENLQYEAAIHGIFGKDNLREVGFIVERLGLGDHLYKKWAELSGGFKLRFALARALVWKPKLLIIDEPLANLDPKAQHVVLMDLRNLADGLRYPMSVLISSQHLHETEAITDKILFLEHGQVKFYGPIKQLGNERRFNTYELRTSCAEQELRDRLKKLNLRQIQHTGSTYVITTPLEVTYRELLEILLHEGIEVEYFHDVSKSVKQLFR